MAHSFLSLQQQTNALVIRIHGDWQLIHHDQLSKLVKQQRSQLQQQQQLQVDFSQLGQLDTTGSQLLIDLLGIDVLSNHLDKSSQLKPAQAQLLRTVLKAQEVVADTAGSITWQQRLQQPIVQLGAQLSALWINVNMLVSFIGLTLATLVHIAFRPKAWRFTALVANLQQVGLNAVPIVALLTFLVGTVVAYLGATLLTKFGAHIYTVHLVSFSFLREFAPLLVAIIVAGRTASAFTAHIGSMRINEELDAIKVLGLNSMELLVIPRLLALLIALPLLTFIAMICGIFGGMVVADFTLDISYTMFLSVLQQNVELRHFWIGMAKAPFFAFIIVMISCLEGFKVKDSAQSVGQHTTSSVVQSIFMVIVIDAIFALISMEMKW